MTHLWGIRGTYDLAVLWLHRLPAGYGFARRYDYSRVGAVWFALDDATDAVRVALALRRAHGTPEVDA